MRKFAIDLFCGAGGMTSGLVRAGYTVLAGVDKEERCYATYVLNNTNKDKSRPKFLALDLFPQTSKYPQGQQKQIICKLKKILQEKKFSRRNGDKLLLAICAPCQPFTKITKIPLTENRAFDQSRDKNLLFTSLDIIKSLKPDAIFCENVEGILSNGTMRKFKIMLEEIDYGFEAGIIRSERFGVPQKRKRTIGIGYRRKWKRRLELDIPESNGTTKKPETVENTIDHLPSLAAGEIDPKIPNHYARNLSDLNLKRISCAPSGGSNRYLKDTPYGDLSLSCHRKLKTPSFSDTYTRMRGDQPSPTITTKFISITNGRFGHYDTKQNRGISVREGALLQTFPQKYVFYPQDNITFAARLIGNAVPPKLAHFFGEYISENILGES